MRIEFEGTVAEFRALFQGGLVMEFFSPPLSVVPPASDPKERTEPESGWARTGEGITAPTNDAALAAAKMELPALVPEQREAAWNHFKGFCVDWARGFGDAEAQQPDRLAMMQELGHGRWPVPVLVMAYEVGSLQMMVCRALEEVNGVIERNFDDRDAYLDHIDLIAANMVQVSHMGFPDLAGTYDYSTKWKRS
jgi:hypothetical protein